MCLKLSLILFLSIICFCYSWSENRRRKFPNGFLFGVASSAYQVEGGWNADGKGESIWDRFIHENPDLILDRSNGDVSSDSYNNYRRDVEMLRELGVDFYRFSISWPRILPNGLAYDKNEKGFDYYDNLIDELLNYNIAPMITLYHFDLPQKIQDLGGWANPLIIDWFEDYARELFKRFSHKVKYWITINQPQSICMQGYSGREPPRVNVKGIGEYICTKNILLAHARVWHLYNNEYKKKHNGQLGISISVNWADPINDAMEHVQAAEEYREFTIGLFMNPIFSKSGDFPKVIKDIIRKKSESQGWTKSRLPTLSAEEIKYLKGSADFLGMNHYTTVLIERPKSKIDYAVPSIEDDMNVQIMLGEKWHQAKSPWLRSAPYGIYKAFNWLNRQYDYPLVYITENGWSTSDVLYDSSRVDYLRNYFDALILAMEDGARVEGYAVWSLMDNFEWMAGYTERFGLYQVDFGSDDKKRTARLSAVVYKQIIESKTVDHEWEPKGLDIQISEKSKKKQKEEL